MSNTCPPWTEQQKKKQARPAKLNMDNIKHMERHTERRYETAREGASEKKRMWQSKSKMGTESDPQEEVYDIGGKLMETYVSSYGAVFIITYGGWHLQPKTKYVHV